MCSKVTVFSYYHPFKKKFTALLDVGIFIHPLRLVGGWEATDYSIQAN